MQKAEFELNLSRSSSGRARSRGLRSSHSKRLGSLEPTVCSLGWFYADTDLRPDPPPCHLRRPRFTAMPPTARIARAASPPTQRGKFQIRVQGHRKPGSPSPALQKDPLHCCVAFSISLALSLSCVRPTCTARCIRLPMHTTLDIERHPAYHIYRKLQPSIRVGVQRCFESCFDRKSRIFCTHSLKHFHYVSLLYKERSH